MVTRPSPTPPNDPHQSPSLVLQAMLVVHPTVPCLPFFQPVLLWSLPIRVVAKF